MKTIILAVAFGLLSAIPVSATASLFSHDNVLPVCSDQDQKKEAAMKTVYTCPMHPEIVQDKAGKCPKCGMNLTAQQVKKEVYTCGCHPEIVQDKAGKCPKCGMDLIAKEAKKDVYTCPMHPEVVNEKAGSKCPKCGMNLVLKKN